MAKVTLNAQYVPDWDDIVSIEKAVQRQWFLDNVPRDLFFIGCGWMLGLRASEVCTLRWDGIDTEKRTLTLHGKYTKARKGQIMPIPNGYPGDLWARLNDLKAHNLKMHGEQSEWIVLNRKGSQLSRKDWFHHYRRIMRRADLLKPRMVTANGNYRYKLSYHSLRRYFFNWLKEANPNADIWELAEAGRCHPWNIWHFYRKSEALGTRKKLICGT